MTTDITCDNPRSPWTTERVAMLRSYFNAGLSCAQIANEIGVSRNAVIGKMNRLGLSRGRRTAAPGAPRAASPRRPHVLTQRIALKAVFAAEPVVTDVVSTEPCSLFNLTARKCRWPIGAVGTPDFNFCGNGRPTEPARPRAHGLSLLGASADADREPPGKDGARLVDAHQIIVRILGDPVARRRGPGVDDLFLTLRFGGDLCGLVL